MLYVREQRLNDPVQGREQLRIALQQKSEALQQESEALQLEASARYAAELRVQKLKSELKERTVAWLKQRGTLSMRGVLGECLPSRSVRPSFTF